MAGMKFKLPTPSAAKGLLAAAQAAGATEARFEADGTMRVIFSNGDEASAEDVSDWFKRREAR